MVLIKRHWKRYAIWEFDITKVTPTFIAFKLELLISEAKNRLFLTFLLVICKKPLFYIIHAWCIGSCVFVKCQLRLFFLISCRPAYVWQLTCLQRKYAYIHAYYVTYYVVHICTVHNMHTMYAVCILYILLLCTIFYVYVCTYVYNM
jgi:hypothetical protein